MAQILLFSLISKGADATSEWFVVVRAGYIFFLSANQYKEKTAAEAPN